MTDDVRPETIKKTQDLLGKYFKKPPLTEKLLRKPPFRFLHDIVSAIINETGFLDGLYTEEELNSENIKNKEAKLAYLTKLIDVIKLATGINLNVRASKIISGQEPTKTNELLQAIGKALDKKISSTDAIEQYKRGSEKRKSPKNKSSVGKEEKRISSKQVSQTKIVSAKEKSTEQKKRLSTENITTTNDTECRKNEATELQKSINVATVPHVESPQSPQEKLPSSTHKRKSSSTRLKSSTTSARLSEAATPLQLEKKTDVSQKWKETENRSNQAMHVEYNESGDQPFDTSDTVNSEYKSVTNTKDNKINENTEKVKQTDNDIKSTEKSVQNMENHIIEATNPQAQNSDIRSRTSLRPPTSRPISARPAAPRIRGKAELIVNEEILTPIGNISVIVENSDLKEDDDAEDMVVMETRGGVGDLENSNTCKVDEQLTQEHGHLVAQILETQKELVNNDNVDVIPKKTNISWDTSSKRDIVAKEVDKLRNTIQILTRATNPLGKLLDYFQEDIEMMLKELLEWRNQYQQVNEQLKIEKIKTQELIEPMKETLKAIEHNMKLQLDKICQEKSQIMKNDQRIQTLLNGRV